MQGRVVELIRELMQAQRMSVRKISAEIAKEHGGSDLGYTQQINRILNDLDYDPTFSTVQKILAALNCSLWQSVPEPMLERIDTRLDRLTADIAALKVTVNTLSESVQVLVEHLSDRGDQTHGTIEVKRSQVLPSQVLSPQVLSPQALPSQVLPIDGETEG